MGDAREPQHLPRGLTATVGFVASVLGEVVHEAEGPAVFDAVESIRLDMVAFRGAARPAERAEALARTRARLSTMTVDEKLRVARAYTLYLELVNACENAYRTHRLRQRGPARAKLESRKARLTFVLTAHPTESRSPQNIRLLRRAQELVVGSLVEARAIDRRALANVLHLAWRVGTHPAHKPSVEDEAAHLFSLLTDPILSELIALTELGHEVLLRTWVGGDKDGHPGVGPTQTVASLDLSRKRLLEFVDRELIERVREDVALSKSRLLESAFDELLRSLADLRPVRDGDGGRIAGLRRSVDDFQSSYGEELGTMQPQMARLTTLLRVFPGLVVPLELREERGRFGEDAPIAGMLRRLAKVAEGGRINQYVRGCVVSMTCEAKDLLEAHGLITTIFGIPSIPVIPLFELPDVLERAPEILGAALRDASYRRALVERGSIEVMLGYSDTAKRMGMLASHVGVHKAMQHIGQWAAKEGLTPLFFHGHGGSVGRGGGRVEDLAATWPPEARSPYKYTLQGEMVERTLATPEILRSLVDKVAAVQADSPSYRGVGELCEELAARSQAQFAARISSPDFLELLGDATPYARLRALTIGSRPVRRDGENRSASLEQLRAIPWVLCWTQTRLLLHAWLGLGEAWRELQTKPDIDDRLEHARRNDPLFRSYVRLLSFTLAKTSPEIWRCYHQALARAASTSLIHELEQDYESAMDFACRMTGAGTLLPDRPWLEESIHYRAPMIHPLNLMQIDLLAKSTWSEAEEQLFRETVTGIAAGMLTTG